MSETISKELLKAVLEIDEKYLQEIIVVDNEVFWTGGDINVYELAHKCKEWVLRNGYILESLSNRSCIMGEEYEYYATLKIHKEVSSMVFHNIDADTEQEAIFEACQWILDNKGK